MKKILPLTCMMLCLLWALAACGQTAADGREPSSPAASQETAGDTGTEATTDAADPEEKTISGIVNRLGSYLVLLDDEGAYHIFDFGEGVDAANLEEGDRVNVTYTGVLDNEDPAPVAAAIEPEA